MIVTGRSTTGTGPASNLLDLHVVCGPHRYLSRSATSKWKKGERRRRFGIRQISNSTPHTQEEKLSFLALDRIGHRPSHREVPRENQSCRVAVAASVRRARFLPHAAPTF